MSISSEFSDFNEYNNDFYSDFHHEETMTEVWENCVILSILSILSTLFEVIVLNFCYGVVSGWVSITFRHALTGALGIYLITTLEAPEGKLIFFECWLIALVLVIISRYTEFYTPNLLKITAIILLVLCEYCLIEHHIWTQIRGIVMVLVMKIISLVEDAKISHIYPTPFQYFGYTLSGANVMIGPWISFEEYMNRTKNPPRKGFLWICSIIQIASTSLTFLTLSNCWANYFITDDSNRWFIAYREAFSFRSSHYFISYLAESAMIASGYFNYDKDGYRYIITEPSDIEIPSSLSIVVKKWNQPMHDFLKKYVYRSWLHHGKFTAILGTFFMSSLLHGLEIKVSMVLLTIGLFSYLQVVPRDKMAEIFDCCVRVRPCKDCKHKHKRNSIIVRLALVTYSFSTIFHLAYLGVLMDPSTNEIGIYDKWQNLFFISHIVMFFNLLVML